MEMLNYLVEILGALLAIAILYIAPKVASWIKIDGEKMETEELLQLVLSFVQAAEQVLKSDDPTGEKRYEYVCERLSALGYDITDTVVSMIEGAVWEVNKAEPAATPLPAPTASANHAMEVSDK